MSELHSIPLTCKEGVYSVFIFIRTPMVRTQSSLTMTHSIKCSPMISLLGRTGVG